MDAFRSFARVGRKNFNAPKRCISGISYRCLPFIFKAFYFTNLPVFMKIHTMCMLLVANCLAITLFAQKPKPKPDVEVINFGEEADKTQDDKQYKGLIVKTSPVSFIFGRQPIELEKEITDFFSLQAGIGVTFLPLWNYSSTFEELLDEGSGYSESTQWGEYDETDYYNDLTIRTGKIGPMLSLSGRLFFESDGYEGMYIAPVLRYSVQKYQVQKVVEGASSLIYDPSDTQKEQVKNFDVMVHWGGQSLYPKLTMEWFIGGGIRLQDNLRQDVGRSASGLYLNGERSFNERNLRLEAGIRVGFQL